MRLPDFIQSNIEPILTEWENFARSLAPGAKMDELALRAWATRRLFTEWVESAPVSISMKSFQSIGRFAPACCDSGVIVSLRQT
ncbi:hypothetical protein PLANPX_2977 [Lacipirellula parvula]|uniref:Uncharacterized protein n=1 Tax=Lacipirellula parvula TaxID=2650471 RepID=A0A5K7XAB4_9BACT|nr:hypothetical protein PLANPX_2977 [Lacipirellula parvula]